jgi:DNA topoisomerase-1
MRLAQQLYEEGLITYHRTDSVNLSTQALDAARATILQDFGATYLPEKPRYFTTKTKNAQEAHEAIRPTDLQHPLDAIKAKLGEQHAKIYDLIWRRMMASQMNAAVYDHTTVMTEAVTDDQQKIGLKTNGSILKFDGWMKLFPNQGDVLLPRLTVHQKTDYIAHSAAQKFTQPPARYNDASLIKTLESEGIGRPSTYASIISVIEDRGYVQRQDKKFVPTPIGLAVNDFLTKYFTTIVDYKFTANMEDDLDAISRGEKDWHKIVGDFYARRGWTWGGVGNDPGYTPEAESIAECIQHLLDHEFLQPGGTISTGRLMVANGEGKSRNPCHHQEPPSGLPIKADRRSYRL